MSDEQSKGYLQVPMQISFDANDVVTYLDNNDELLFRFIMDILEHENVGIELRERLVLELNPEIEGT